MSKSSDSINRKESDYPPKIPASVTITQESERIGQLVRKSIYKNRNKFIKEFDLVTLDKAFQPPTLDKIGIVRCIGQGGFWISVVFTKDLCDYQRHKISDLHLISPLECLQNIRQELFFSLSDYSPLHLLCDYSSSSESSVDSSTGSSNCSDNSQDSGSSSSGEPSSSSSSGAPPNRIPFKTGSAINLYIGPRYKETIRVGFGPHPPL